jgi:hypothetical protein
MSRKYPVTTFPNASQNEQLLIFPGGGIYFWWQAGLVKALQQRYDLQKHSLSMSGASAGSISCVMAICNVDMDHGMEVALRLADEASVFTRPGGLSGVWGGLIEKWLKELLPDDCHLTCSGKVNISVTSLTVTLVPLHRHVINSFESKQDLIDACLTSVHVPYFIDGNFFRKYRGEKCLDGSLLFFMHSIPWRTSYELGENPGACIFNHCNDQKLMQRNWGFLQTIDKKSFAEMFSLGYQYGLRWVKRQKYSIPPTRPESVWRHGDVTLSMSP